MFSKFVGQIKKEPNTEYNIDIDQYSYYSNIIIALLVATNEPKKPFNKALFLSIMVLLLHLIEYIALQSHGPLHSSIIGSFATIKNRYTFKQLVRIDTTEYFGQLCFHSSIKTKKYFVNPFNWISLLLHRSS